MNETKTDAELIEMARVAGREFGAKRAKIANARERAALLSGNPELLSAGGPCLRIIRAHRVDWAEALGDAMLSAYAEGVRGGATEALS